MTFPDPSDLRASDLLETPDPPEMHPVSGDTDLRTRLVTSLGDGTSGVVAERSFPLRDTPLAFGAREAEEAYDAIGANCGPGAIAAAIGSSPMAIASGMPGFSRLGYTTEIMAALSLALNGVRFSWSQPFRDPFVSPWPDHGLVRVGYGDGDVMSLMRRSHWVASRNVAGRLEVFDINAMGAGGWIAQDEWRHELSPWLSSRFFDGAPLSAEIDVITF